MGFDDVIGQKQAILYLRAAYQRERIPNAYLFAGPEGVGKSLTALLLARLLNCEAPLPGPDPCESCRSCRQIAQGNHPDVWTVAPAENSKVIKIDQLRELRRMVRFPPRNAQKRVVLLDGVEKMNTEAANAFLKSLEEPPSETLFVLLTPAPHQLLPTILSRCQRVSFGALPRPELISFLTEHHDLPLAKASLAAALAEGSLGRALSLGTDLLGERRQEWLQQLVRLSSPDQGTLLALDLAQEFSREPDQIPTLLTLLRTWYRDLLILREVQDAPLINEDLQELLQQQAQKTSTESIFRAIRTIEQTEAALQRNAAPTLTLERLFLLIGGDRCDTIW